MVKNLFLLPVVLFSFISTFLTAVTESQFYQVAPDSAGYRVYIPNVQAGVIPVAQPAPTKEVVEQVRNGPSAEFIQSVRNGQGGVVRGVWAEDDFSLPVVQQPQGQAGYVATQNGVITQFAPAAQRGSIGLLAHNYLSGAQFSNLSVGEAVAVVYGDGAVVHYRITQIKRFQALDPTSFYSKFIDQDDPQKTQITSNDLFEQMYGVPDRVVFQTCIDAYGNASWGRLFVIAEKE